MSSASNFIKPLVYGPIIEEDAVFRTTISINPDSSIFDGHFPGFPILPGVVLIDLIHELIAQIQRQPLRLIEASNVKFLKAVQPENDKELLARLTVSESSDQVLVHVLITDHFDKEVFKGQFKYVKYTD